jgi:hypothetical protein
VAKRKKARDLTTEGAMRRLFPKEVREELKKEALKARDKATKRHSK